MNESREKTSIQKAITTGSIPISIGQLKDCQADPFYDSTMGI